MASDTGRNGRNSMNDLTPLGRGAVSNPANRFLPIIQVQDLEQIEYDDDIANELSRPKTVYYRDTAKSIISSNDSPDIPFRFSLNPYRGCQHGCSYCYARTSHEYLGLSAGLDFETKIFVKTAASRLLRDWLNRPGYDCESIMLSGVTDCYQPIERSLQITRQCLEVAVESRQPMALITKNSLICRDIDLLSKLAWDNLARAAISITTLDQSLSKVMEPRCSAPAARVKTVQTLAAAGVPVHVMIAPVIPGLNDSEIPQILNAVADAGASSASFITLRLAETVDLVFLEWLHRTYPDRAAGIESRVRSTHGGRLNTARFGERMRGSGIHAEQISALFQVARRKAGLDNRLRELNTQLFIPPKSSSGQGRLF
jgi:DNA repair photolyase